MPKNCFVPGCETVFKTRCKRKPGEKTLTFFGAPKDPMLRKQWRIASRRGDREMTVRDVICELHFTEDCLLRHYTTELYDGSMFKLERGRAALKKGSVPTIFPFSKSNVDSKGGKREKLDSVQNKGENKCQDFDLGRDISPSKMNQVRACSAYGCTNSSDKKIPGISFHRFPTDKLQKAWMNAICQKDLMPPGENVLCSAHFSPNQIEQTGSSPRLKSFELPTIFFSGKKNQGSKLLKNLQTDMYDSSDSDRNESYSTEMRDFSVQYSDEDEVSMTETDSFVQGEKDEIPEQISSSDEEMPSTSSNLIAEGHENIFGKFVASELRILSCDPPLYLRTKEKIWRVLEETSRMRVT